MKNAMYRYDLLFRNAKTGAGNWIVGFASLEAARAYADRLRNARRDDNIVCTLYARTVEGDFHRYTGNGFSPEPKPEGVKYRYIVVSEDGSIGQAFEDRQSAQDFMDGNPGLLLRLRAQRADGFAAPTAQAENQDSRISRSGNGSPTDPEASKAGDQASPGARSPGRPRRQNKPGRSWVAPALAGAAGAGIGAFAANAAFADSAGQGAAAEPFAAEGFSGEGTPFGGEGFSAAGLGEGGAFAGEGLAGTDIGEGGAFLGEGFSAAGLGGSVFAAEGLSGADLGGGEPLVNDIQPCDDGSMIAAMAPGENILADPSQDLAGEDIAGLEDGFPAEDIAGDDEGGFFGTIASLFSDE